MRFRLRDLDPRLILCVVALTAVVGFEVAAVAHYAYDLSCAVKDGGDIDDCYFCSVFRDLTLEVAAAVEPPAPGDAAPLPRNASGGHVHTTSASAVPARAPPAA